MSSQKPEKSQAHDTHLLAGALVAVISLIVFLWKTYDKLSPSLKHAVYGDDTWNEFVETTILLFIFFLAFFAIILFVRLSARFLSEEKLLSPKILKDFPENISKILFAIFCFSLVYFLAIMFFFFLISFSILTLPGIHVGLWGIYFFVFVGVLLFFKTLPSIPSHFKNESESIKKIQKNNKIFRKFPKWLVRVCVYSWFLCLAISLLGFLLFIFVIVIWSELPYPYIVTGILIAVLLFSFASREKYGVAKGIASIIMGLSVIFFALFVLHVAVNTVHYFSGDFEIELDKPHYFEDEDVFLTIYPSGTFKPRIQEVAYSNNDTLLLNQTGDEFHIAPSYVKINSSILTTVPSDSFVVIKYKFGRPCLSFLSAFLISEITCRFFPEPPKQSKIKFIPVFPIDKKTKLNSSSIS